MKGNYRGHLLFIRTYDADTRNAVLSMYNKFTKEIQEYKDAKTKEAPANAERLKGLSTTLAHVFPNIDADGKSNRLYGYIKPVDLAKKILGSVSQGRDELYFPDHMIYITYFNRFWPAPLVEMVENFWFGK